MFETATGSHHQPTDEAELTPIFHALAQCSGDPEHFHQDPLHAPMPPSSTAAQGLPRTLLHVVPARHAQPPAHRAFEREPEQTEDLTDRQPGCVEALRATPRSGRHRILRVVSH